jgi:hypothetical protein
MPLALSRLERSAPLRSAGTLWTTSSETDLALIAARPEVQGRPPVVRRDPLHVLDYEVESEAPTGDSGVSLAVAALARAHPALERGTLGSNCSAGLPEPLHVLGVIGVYDSAISRVLQPTRLNPARRPGSNTHAQGAGPLQEGHLRNWRPLVDALRTAVFRLM